MMFVRDKPLLGQRPGLYQHGATPHVTVGTDPKSANGVIHLGR
jgi:hypothetical protein